MTLFRLLEGITYTILKGSVDTEIKKIEYDSRKIDEGNVFVCITGFLTDGHIYAKKAVQSGAVALICEKPIEDIADIMDIDRDITVIQVENTRAALAVMAKNYYDDPSATMNVYGVTGTNGKTTITYLIKSILDGIGKKVGVIGTIENRIGDEVIPTKRTTPESLELQQLFRRMSDENVTDVVMEVSSHSLDLYRVDGISMNIGIFTNLTQDHLDYHKTMENYKKAKSLLFKSCKHNVINIDDTAGEYMLSCSKGECLTFGIDRNADLRAMDIAISAEGVKFVLSYKDKKYEISLNTTGKFSIYNALGAIGACVFMGISMNDIINGLKSNKGVTGRFQTVKGENGFNAIVDYAHTPDGLSNILNTAREFTKGKIITVFGCGGDRDRLKRPIMGEITGNLSDYCIITSDNPRSENPMEILKDVEVGVVKSHCEYTKLVDRREAIKHAVSFASSGDLIIIAGKGHETYQIFSDKTIHFDDVEEVMKAFEEEQV